MSVSAAPLFGGDGGRLAQFGQRLADDGRRALQGKPPADYPSLGCFYYFFMVVVIRYETTATARWALLLIVRAFFNDTITVAVWTGFHVRLMDR